MPKLVSILAVLAGIWLVYSGYERQHSLAGSADDTMSRLGQRIDGAGRTPTHIWYYAAGAVLLAGGLAGLGVVRR